jgi:hypothetical protein
MRVAYLLTKYKGGGGYELNPKHSESEEIKSIDFDMEQRPWNCYCVQV